MTKSRRAATSARTPASVEATAGKPAAAPVVAGTRLSARGAFALNVCFVAGLLVLSQLSLLQQRATVRTSIVVAALLLLAWSGLLFGVLRRGQKMALDIVPRRQHYLQDGSRWACNELGILLTEHYGNRRRAAMEFERACGLEFSARCDNVSVTQGNTFRRHAPTVADYQFLLRGSKGPFADREPARLYARACEQGWPDACGIR